MRLNCCRKCLDFILKFLNFLLRFVGVSIIIYSVLILNQTIKHGFLFSLDFDSLPTPWFVCGLMGVGILICSVAFTGYIAAEAISSCLSFYAILVTIMILLEAALVGDLVWNREWKKDLLVDTTGELKRLITFVEESADIFKWAGVSIVAIQALSILLASLLRAMIPGRVHDYDSDDGLDISKLFLIQKAVLEPAMQNLIGRAKIGTGKTLAFGIPILYNIICYNATHGRGRNYVRSVASFRILVLVR